MMKVTKVEIEPMENAGCNNGNYPTVTVTFSDGEEYSAFTCRCHKGCSGTIRVPKVGMKFNDIHDFIDYTEGCN